MGLALATTLFLQYTRRVKLEMAIKFSRSDFPKEFVFGTATAAYQIEGSAYGQCGPSHWDTFAAVSYTHLRAHET